MYLALAEAHLKKGMPQRAEYCFQPRAATCPGSRQAESAQVRLTQIQSIAPRPEPALEQRTDERQRDEVTRL